MSASLVSLARELIGSETPKRREKALQRINQLKEKLKPGGDWRIVDPSPLWEACNIWIAETRQLGLDIVDHILQHPDAQPLLKQPDKVEPFRRFMYDWAMREQEDSVIANCQALLKDLGVTAEQEMLTVRERVAWHMAQATKEFLTKIFKAGRATRAV